MRRVSKPWPPADVSPVGQPARRFVDAERDYLRDLDATREEDQTGLARSRFDQLAKSKLRKAMDHEQRSLCIYCEARLEAAEHGPRARVEHWRPLAREPRYALAWKNLYLSCPRPDTCDDAKANRPLKWDDRDPGLPWPTECAYEKLLGFTSRGEIYVRKDAVLDAPTRKALELALDDQPEGRRKRRAILNLNHPSLVAARAAALDDERDSLRRAFKNRAASRQDRTRRATALTAGRRWPRYVSIRLAWLHKTLGKGR